MKPKANFFGQRGGRFAATTVANPVRGGTTGQFASSKALRDFDARLEQAHQRADTVLAKLASRGNQP